MRVAGEDEAVDPERHVFLHTVSDLLRIADERRASPAAHQPYARPEVRADRQLVLPPAMQPAHPLLTDGIELGERLLRRRDRFLVDVFDERVCRGPGLFL